MDAFMHACMHSFMHAFIHSLHIFDGHGHPCGELQKMFQQFDHPLSTHVTNGIKHMNYVHFLQQLDVA